MFLSPRAGFARAQASQHKVPLWDCGGFIVPCHTWLSPGTASAPPPASDSVLGLSHPFSAASPPSQGSGEELGSVFWEGGSCRGKGCGSFYLFSVRAGIKCSGHTLSVLGLRYLLILTHSTVWLADRRTSMRFFSGFPRWRCPGYAELFEKFQTFQAPDAKFSNTPGGSSSMPGAQIEFCSLQGGMESILRTQIDFYPVQGRMESIPGAYINFCPVHGGMESILGAQIDFYPVQRRMESIPGAHTDYFCPFQRWNPS